MVAFRRGKRPVISPVLTTAKILLFGTHSKIQLKKNETVIITIIIVILTSLESKAESGFCHDTAASLSICDKEPAAAAAERLEDGAVPP